MKFSNAFSRANNDVLLSILTYIRCTPLSFDWFPPYLCEPLQFIRVKQVLHTGLIFSLVYTRRYTFSLFFFFSERLLFPNMFPVSTVTFLLLLATLLLTLKTYKEPLVELLLNACYGTILWWRPRMKEWFEYCRNVTKDLMAHISLYHECLCLNIWNSYMSLHPTQIISTPRVVRRELLTSLSPSIVILIFGFCNKV